ncbi:UDP binding domain-containing protein [Mycolicibacterium thermoresistibile]|nr:UDP-glucose/GDP-mannose dehydrogenase family protein [Mycolicibacterium thermoresistibile]MCV7189792.1 hypothetical protein [Mycolicibacterium thermoresistibile]
MSHRHDPNRSHQTPTNSEEPDPYLAAKDADAILVLTEWPEFRDLDWAFVAEQAPGAVLVDTRNLLDRAAVTEAGLTYLGNGTAPGY